MLQRLFALSRTMINAAITDLPVKDAGNLCGLNQVLLEGTDKLLLLGRCLVSAVTELAGCVDPFEVDLLECAAGGVDEHGLSEGHDTLLHTRDGTLEEHEVVLNLTVADKATKTDCLLVFDFMDVSSERTYGVMAFLLWSKSVVALPSSLPLPMR